MLVLTAYSKRGIGGTMQFKFTYRGCWKVEIDYKCSQIALESGRHLQLLTLSLAFFISGKGYAGYRKTLEEGLGLSVTSEKTFQR